MMHFCYIHESGKWPYPKKELKKSQVLTIHSASAIIVSAKELGKLNKSFRGIKSQLAEFDLTDVELHPRKICYAKKPFQKLKEENRNLEMMKEIAEGIAKSGAKLISRVSVDLKKSESLMPLKTKVSEIKNRITIKGYEMVWCPERRYCPRLSASIFRFLGGDD